MIYNYLNDTITVVGEMQNHPKMIFLLKTNHMAWFHDDLLRNYYLFDTSEVIFVRKLLKDYYFVNLACFYAPNVQFLSYVGWVNSRDLNVTEFIENNARKLQN